MYWETSVLIWWVVAVVFEAEDRTVIEEREHIIDSLKDARPCAVGVTGSGWV